MADTIHKSNRHTLEFTVEELFFIQHCIVYFGCCLSGNGQGAMSSFAEAANVLHLIDVEKVQDRILAAVGIDTEGIEGKSGEVQWLMPKGETKELSFPPKLDKNIQ